MYKILLFLFHEKIWTRNNFQVPCFFTRNFYFYLFGMGRIFLPDHTILECFKAFDLIIER